MFAFHYTTRGVLALALARRMEETRYSGTERGSLVMLFFLSN